MKIGDLRDGMSGDIYNNLPLETQMELLKELPIGSTICLSPISEEDKEYRIIGYELVNDENDEWINLKLDKEYSNNYNYNKNTIHPGFAYKSEKIIRNEKLKLLGI